MKTKWWIKAGYGSPSDIYQKIDWEGGLLEFLKYGFNSEGTPFDKEWKAFAKAVNDLENALEEAGVVEGVEEQ